MLCECLPAAVGSVICDRGAEPWFVGFRTSGDSCRHEADLTEEGQGKDRGDRDDRPVSIHWNATLE